MDKISLIFLLIYIVIAILAKIFKQKQAQKRNQPKSVVKTPQAIDDISDVSEPEPPPKIEPANTGGKDIIQELAKEFGIPIQHQLPSFQPDPIPEPEASPLPEIQPTALDIEPSITEPPIISPTKKQEQKSYKNRLIAAINQRRGLQEAIILKTILDKPLGLKKTLRFDI